MQRRTLFGGHALACLLVLCPTRGQLRPEAPMPMLPKAISSFGAARAGAWVYAYGGHVGRAHQHSRDNLSGSLYRHRVGADSWEELAAGPPLQSPSLVAHEGRLYRVGGLDAKNEQGAKPDLWSVGSVQRYDPELGEWAPVRALPEPRSSHDAWVLGDTLWVVGGWHMAGRGSGRWHKTTLALDLSQAAAEWVAYEQPFETRALSCAASRGRLVAIGGMGRRRPTNEVWILDPRSGKWSAGPAWPGFAFATSATTIDGDLYASGLDGIVYRLDGHCKWTRVATLAHPRFFHRLVPLDEHRLVAIGGADRAAHLPSCEAVALGSRGPSLTVHEVVFPGSARRAQSVGTLRDRLLLAGGTRSTEPHSFAPDDFVREVWSLHPGSLDWNRLPDLPVARLSQGILTRTSGRSGGEVFAIGGARPSNGSLRTTNDVFTLTLGAENWKPVPGTLPDGRMQFGVTVHEGKLWLFGGAAFVPDREPRWRFPADVLQGALGEEVLPSGVSLAAPRRAFAGAALGNRYYVVGGLGPEHAFVDTAEVFDFTDRSWKRIASPAKPRSMADLVAVGSRLYLVGGWSPGGGAGGRVPNRSLEVFDPQAGSWSTLVAELPFATEHSRAVSWHHRILVFALHEAGGETRCRLWVVDPGRMPKRARAKAAARSASWPSFRGGRGGHTSDKTLPRRWTDQENIVWTANLPGYGQSSPVVHHGRVFVTSVAGPNKELCQVACYRAADGHLLWSRSYPASVLIKHTKTVSRGAPTPAVDDQAVYSFFESGDLFALSHDGDTRWHRSLSEEYGPYEGNHGFGSSLVLVPGGVVLLLDHSGPSHLLEIDRKTGRNVWKVDRRPRVSWATPVVARIDGGHEIVVSSSGSVEGFDAATGKRRWVVEGLSGNTVPSPCVTREHVVVAASKGEGNLLVRRPRAGAARATIVWQATGSRPTGFASPLVLGDHVYFLNKAGSLACVKLSDGELCWRQRIAEGCWASPITDGELIWYFGKSGRTTVVRPTEQGATIVAENAVPTDDTVYGVAAAGGAFFVREGQRLSCIRNASSTEPKPTGR